MWKTSLTGPRYDPARGLSVSADDRPQGKLNSTISQPVKVIPGGFHCSDMYADNGKVNAGVAAVQKAEIEQISKWVKEFKTVG